MKLDDEMWLEVGLGVLLVSILAGILAVLGGRGTERLRAQASKAEGPPAPGTVSTERHMNISTNPAR